MSVRAQIDRLEMRDERTRIDTDGVGSERLGSRRHGWRVVVDGSRSDGTNIEKGTRTTLFGCLCRHGYPNFDEVDARIYCTCLKTCLRVVGRTEDSFSKIW